MHCSYELAQSAWWPICGGFGYEEWWYDDILSQTIQMWMQDNTCMDENISITWITGLLGLSWFHECFQRESWAKEQLIGLICSPQEQRNVLSGDFSQFGRTYASSVLFWAQSGLPRAVARTISTSVLGSLRKQTSLCTTAFPKVCSP